MHFRLTSAQKEKIQRLADEVELSASDYVRKAALKQKIVPRFTDEELALMAEVREARNDIRNFSKILDLKTKDYTPEARKKWILHNQNFEQWAYAIGLILERLDTFYAKHME